MILNNTLFDLAYITLITSLLFVATITKSLEVSKQRDWNEVNDVLESQVQDHQAFPGCVAIVADRTGILRTIEVGAHTYETNATRMSLNNTLFDLASLTKVTTTTTAAMQMYEMGMLALEDHVATYFSSDFVSIDTRKRDMTIHHLLVHSAGYVSSSFSLSFSLSPSPSLSLSRTHTHTHTHTTHTQIRTRSNTKFLLSKHGMSRDLKTRLESCRDVRLS
jgi:CubicO group peptidase (beta-lactamase class C family)